MAKDKKLQNLRSVMGKFYDEHQGNDDKNRTRIMDVNFQVLRNMAHRDVLVQGIIKKRCDQVKAFLQPETQEEPRGFKIVKKKNGERDKRSEELEQFFVQTGFEYDPEREDDIMDFTDMIIRETLTIDQMAIELRRTKGGDVFDFWLLDGATVSRTTDDKHRYVQRVQLPIVEKNVKGKSYHEAFFTADDLIFDYMNKRADVKYRGYGYSALEQSIDIVTTFLFGINYNRDLFVKEKIPKGFLKVMGDADPTTIAAIQRYWRQQMEGYGAKFKIPVIPSGKEGTGLEFQSLAQNNREMEYSKLLDLIMTLQALPFGIDLAELGIKTDRHQAIIAESGYHRMQHSKDSGLGSLLMYLTNIYNKILSKVDGDYVWKFTGIKDEDKEKEETIKRKRLESYVTINEIRKEEGLEEIDEDYANVVLNPQAVSIYNASKMNAQMGGMGGEGDFNEEDQYDQYGDEDNADFGTDEEESTDEGPKRGNKRGIGEESNTGQAQEPDVEKAITYGKILMKSRKSKVLVI